MSPAAGVIDKDHEADGGPAKNIQRIKALVHVAAIER
jgi:hypothetical protein